MANVKGGTLPSFVAFVLVMGTVGRRGISEGQNKEGKTDVAYFARVLYRLESMYGWVATQSRHARPLGECCWHWSYGVALLRATHPSQKLRTIGRTIGKKTANACVGGGSPSSVRKTPDRTENKPSEV